MPDTLLRPVLYSYLHAIIALNCVSCNSILRYIFLASLQTHFLAYSLRLYRRRFTFNTAACLIKLTWCAAGPGTPRRGVRDAAAGWRRQNPPSPPEGCRWAGKAASPSCPRSLHWPAPKASLVGIGGCRCRFWRAGAGSRRE